MRKTLLDINLMVIRANDSIDDKGFSNWSRAILGFLQNLRDILAYDTQSEQVHSSKKRDKYSKHRYAGYRFNFEKETRDEEVTTKD